MSDDSVSIWKSTMHSGAVTAMVMIGFLLLTYILEISENKGLGFVSYIILFGGIHWGMKTYKVQSGGFLSYGASFRTGVLVSLFGGIIISFATFLLYTLDPSLMEKAIAMAESTLLENGFSEDMVEQQMAAVTKMMTPIGMFWSGIVGYVLLGLLFSAIAAIFVKKDPPPFS